MITEIAFLKKLNQDIRQRHEEIYHLNQRYSMNSFGPERHLYLETADGRAFPYVLEQFVRLHSDTRLFPVIVCLR